MGRGTGTHSLKCLDKPCPWCFMWQGCLASVCLIESFLVSTLLSVPRAALPFFYPLLQFFVPVTLLFTESLSPSMAGVVGSPSLHLESILCYHPAYLLGSQGKARRPRNKSGPWRGGINQDHGECLEHLKLLKTPVYLDPQKQKVC